MNRGIISGYFNPLHYGHIEYIHGAKLRCDHLTVIVNNDKQVALKGSVPFMSETHRILILQNIRGVDWVILSVDEDKTVCNSLRKVREMYPDDDLTFFNSGDRTQNNLEPAEGKICKELRIKEVVLNQQKVYSSSELIRKAKSEV
jgi:D-beta-D-heptose 7-phosphate kinase/D-beta-D-heptose 1-phosphate adenosyltransferase